MSFLLLQTYPYLLLLFFVSPTLLLFSILLSNPTPLLQTFPYLPSLFFLSSSIILLSTALLIFSVRISSHPTPLPFPSLLSLPHVLPPPIDLPLSSFTLFPFPLHRSPSYPSPHILRSCPSIPYTPPISLLPFTASCPSSSYRPSPLLTPLPSYPSLVMPPQVTNALFSTCLPLLLFFYQNTIVLLLLLN